MYSFMEIQLFHFCFKLFNISYSGPTQKLIVTKDFFSNSIIELKEYFTVKIFHF